MGGIVKLALAVLDEVTTLARARERASRVVFAAILLTLMAMMIAASVGCALAALWIALLPMVGPWAAPLICAGALALVAAALCCGGYLLTRSHNPSPTAGGTLAAAVESGDFAPLIHEHKWILLVLAALGGIASAEKSRKSSRKR